MDAMLEITTGFEDESPGACIVMTVGDGRLPEPLWRWHRILLILRIGGRPRAAVRIRSPVGWIGDRVDEHRARRLRFQLGRRRWLVSWQRQDDGRWLARLSCPSLVFTLERSGKTRTAAIAHAVSTLDVILSLRYLLHRGSLEFAEDAEQFIDPGS
jgi:hypothetical protein